jgi:hypothetical protein
MSGRNGKGRSKLEPDKANDSKVEVIRLVAQRTAKREPLRRPAPPKRVRQEQRRPRPLIAGPSQRKVAEGIEDP